MFKGHQPSTRLGASGRSKGNMQNPTESFRPRGDRYGRLSMGQTKEQVEGFQRPHKGSQR